jgi:hypothetical protein
MLVFDIPFQPADGVWRVDTPGGDGRSFDGRHQAVLYAAKEASRLSAGSGGVFLSIEGVDGVWRLFGANLKAAG